MNTRSISHWHLILPASRKVLRCSEYRLFIIFFKFAFFRSWLLKNAQSECDVFYINVQSQNMVSPIRGQLFICSHQWILRSNQFIIKISPIPFSYFHSEANLSTATLQHAEILYPLRAAWHILGVFKYCIGGEYYTRRLWNTKLNR